MKKLAKDSPEVKFWKLAEECGEVVQALSKIKRFGLNVKRRGLKTTNKANLKAELADLYEAMLAVEEIL